MYDKTMFGTLLGFILVVLILFGVFLCNKDKIDSWGKAINTSTAIQTTSDGLKYVQAIHADINTLKAVIGQRDSLIGSLINKHTMEIVKLEQQIKVLKATRVDSVIYVKSESGEMMPEYHSAFKDRFLDYNIAAGPDTCKLDLTVFSSPVIITEWKRNSLFGPKEVTIYVKDQNPYVNTTGIVPTVVKDKKKNTGLKVLGALAVGAFLGVTAR